MQHDGDVDLGPNGLETLDIERRLGLLHGVHRAQRTGQRVATCALNKIEGLVGIGHGGPDFLRRNTIGGCEDPAQFRLDRNATDMRDLHNLQCSGNVFLIRLLGAIEHE